jgi:hypothetical protein
MLYAAPMVNIFSRMNLCLIYGQPNLNAKFITSDKPIVATTNGQVGKYQRWIDDPEAVLYFPLSSLTCLMMDFKAESRVFSARPSNIASINGMVASECVYVAISEQAKFIWLRRDETISDSCDELFELLQDDKRNVPRVNSILGEQLKSKCRSSIDILRGHDR